MDRVIYEVIGPEESVLKKVRSIFLPYGSVYEAFALQVRRVGPLLSHLRSITVILSDSCLLWDDMDSQLGIESYLFFPETKERFGLTSPSMFATKT